MIVPGLGPERSGSSRGAKAGPVPSLISQNGAFLRNFQVTGPAFAPLEMPDRSGPSPWANMKISHEDRPWFRRRYHDPARRSGRLSLSEANLDAAARSVEDVG